jgi:hypothetical protein
MFGNNLWTTRWIVSTIDRTVDDSIATTHLAQCRSSDNAVFPCQTALLALCSQSVTPSILPCLRSPGFR